MALAQGWHAHKSRSVTRVFFRCVYFCFLFQSPLYPPGVSIVFSLFGGRGGGVAPPIRVQLCDDARAREPRRNFQQPCPGVLQITVRIVRFSPLTYGGKLTSSFLVALFRASCTRRVTPARARVHSIVPPPPPPCAFHGGAVGAGRASALRIRIPLVRGWRGGATRRDLFYMSNLFWRLRWHTVAAEVRSRHLCFWIQPESVTRPLC